MTLYGNFLAGLIYDPENLHTEINSFRCIFFSRRISAELRAILGKLKENNDSGRKFLGRSHIWLAIYVSICIGHIMLVLLNTARWKFNDFDLTFPCYPMSDHIKLTEKSDNDLLYLFHFNFDNQINVYEMQLNSSQSWDFKRSLNVKDISIIYASTHVFHTDI